MTCSGPKTEIATDAYRDGWERTFGTPVDPLEGTDLDGAPNGDEDDDEQEQDE